MNKIQNGAALVWLQFSRFYIALWDFVADHSLWHQGFMAQYHYIHSPCRTSDILNLLYNFLFL